MRKPLTVIAAVAALTACGADTDDTTDGRPGNPAVYERISSTEDCAALQQEFDTAETNGGETGTAYMKAADEQMRELDCY